MTRLIRVMVKDCCPNTHASKLFEQFSEQAVYLTSDRESFGGGNDKSAE
jgi:hypothetical protein